MPGRSPTQAFKNYIKPLRQALQCITDSRLTVAKRQTIEVDTLYAVVLNDMDPVPIRGEIPLGFTAGQTVSIITTEASDPRGPYRASTARYFYEIATTEGQEILSFHWTPEEPGRGAITFPHLHVGRALIANQTTIRPEDFHKVHIPTGRVSIEAVVRLLITEFGVTHRNPRWRQILQRSETAFPRWQTW